MGIKRGINTMLSLIKDNLCTNANVINNYTVEKYKCKISPN